MSKNENGTTVKFLYSFLNSSKSISDEWLVAICWSYCLFGIFMIKKFVVFSLTSFGTQKYDCVMNNKETLNNLPLINSSFITGWSFILLIISVIISSITINTLRLISRLHFFMSFQYSMKAFGSLNCFKPTFSLFFLRY